MAGTETLVAVVEARLTGFEAALRRVESLINRTENLTRQANRRMESSFTSLTSTIRAFGVSLSLVGIVAFGNQAIQASNRAATLDISLKTILGSALAAKTEMAFLRQEANRVGINFMTLAEGFKGVAAAAQGTILQGEGVRQVMLGASEAGRVMGLSNATMTRLFVGLTQIMGKGVVQMEEWRQQVAEALPQATQVMGRALNKTTQELYDMISAGRVGLPELRKWAEQLRREVAGGMEEASRTFVAAQARMSTAVTDLLTALGNIITKNPDVIANLNATAAAIGRMADAIEKRQGAWGTIIKVFDFLAKAAGPAIRDAFKVLTEPLVGATGGKLPVLEQLNEINNAMIKQDQLIKGLQAKKDDPSGKSRFFFNLFDLGGSTLDQEIAKETAKLTEFAKKRDEIIRQMQPAPPPAGFFGDKVAPIQMGETLLSKEQQIEQNLNRFREMSKEANKLRETIAEIEKQLQQNREGTLPLKPEDITFLNSKLEQTKDNLAKMIDPKSFDAAKKALRESESEAKKFETTIDRLAGKSLEDLDKQIAALKQRSDETDIPGEIDAINEAITKLSTQRLEIKLGESFEETMRQAYEAEDTWTQAYEGMAEQVTKFDAERTESAILGEEIALQTKAALADVTKAEAEQIDIQLDMMDKSSLARKALLEQRYQLHLQAVNKETALEMKALDERVKAMQFALVDDRTIAERAAADRARIIAQATTQQQRLFADKTQEARREFERWADDVRDETKDIIGTWTEGLTTGAKTVEELWAETVDNIFQRFVRMLSDMAAEALANHIIIPLLMQTFGGMPGGTAGGGGGWMGMLGGGGGGGGVLGYLQQGQALYRTGQQGYNLLFGGGAAGAGTVGGYAVGGAGSGVYAGTYTGLTGIQGGYTGVTTAGGAYVLDTGAAASLGTGATIGGIATGALTGAAVGFGTSQLLGSLGVGGPANTITSGAIGGATAGAYLGTVVWPVVGTVAGAAAGAVIGAKISALIHLLGAEKSEPSSHLQLLTAPNRRGDFLEGQSARGPFGFVGANADYSNRIQAATVANVFADIDTAIAKHLTKRQVQIASKALQAEQGNAFQMNFPTDKAFEDIVGKFTIERMQTILEGLSKPLLGSKTDIQTFTEKVLGDFPDMPSKEDIQAMEEKFAAAAQFLNSLAEMKDPSKPLSQAEQALAALNQQFDTLRSQAMEYGVGLGIIEEGRVRAIRNLFETALDAMKQQQRAVLRMVKDAQGGLEESLMSPAAVFIRRRGELEHMQGQFFGASPGAQVAMVPDLVRRVQELFQLAQSDEVLGQDRPALEKLQRQLLGFLEQVEQTAGRDAFRTQFAAANEQIDLLRRISKVEEKHLGDISQTLRRMELFMARTQAPPGGPSFAVGTDFVPETGWAYVHRGERIIPRHENQGGQQASIHAPISITIQGGSGMNEEMLAQMIAREVAAHIASLESDVRYQRRDFATTIPRARRLQTLQQSPMSLRRG